MRVTQNEQKRIGRNEQDISYNGRVVAGEGGGWLMFSATEYAILFRQRARQLIEPIGLWLVSFSF